MKNWVLVIAAVVALGLGTVLGAVVKGGPRFGYVDPAQVWAQSKLGASYREQIRTKEQELNARFAELSNEQKAQRRDEFLSERNKLESDLLSKFQARMNEEVQKSGKKHRLDAVFSRSVMPYGRLDLTDEIVKSLDK